MRFGRHAAERQYLTVLPLLASLTTVCAGSLQQEAGVPAAGGFQGAQCRWGSPLLNLDLKLFTKEAGVPAAGGLQGAERRWGSLTLNLNLNLSTRKLASLLLEASKARSAAGVP